jgi:hypothetical protein
MLSVHLPLEVQSISEINFQACLKPYLTLMPPG